MASTFSNAASALLLITLLTLLAAALVAAVEHDIHWGRHELRLTHYAKWAAKKTFTTDDFLVFKYKKGDHDVIKVPKVDYESCLNTTILFSWATGHDKVPLEAGDQFFISDFEGDCKEGMKVAITNVAPGKAQFIATATAAASAGAVASPAPAPAPMNSSSSVSILSVIVLVLGAVSAMAFFFLL